MPTPHVNSVPSSIAPWAVQQRIGTAAARHTLNSVLMPEPGPSRTDYRSGVMASGDGDDQHVAMKVEPDAGMMVTVAEGNAVINTPNQGAYMCCLDSAKTVRIPPSSATTARYDLVVACVYDDDNPAIPGARGLWPFAVEVVKGDASVGTPLVPEVPVGCIPLASVYVGRGVAAITPDLITDLRGPGLVARGGLRTLYGADSAPESAEFQRPGDYPGDQRWVHQAGFPHQVYYGQSQGWRGVFNAMAFTDCPTQGGWLWTALEAGSRREWSRVTIPYPGTPYMIYPSARVHCSLSALTAAEALITDGSPTGAVFSWAGVDIGAGVGNPVQDTVQTLNVAPLMWGPYFSSIDVVLSGHVVSTGRSGGGGIAAHGSARTMLSVLVVPSTVAPPSGGTGGQLFAPGVPHE